MQITVLGTGLIGSAIVRDLAGDADGHVTAVDLNPEAITALTSEARISGVVADLSNTDAIPDLIAGSDLVICAVPGFMGFDTLKAVIKAGHDVVDISFFDQDPFLLDDLARANGVTAIVDCGVAPGLHNIILGYMDSQLDQIQRTVCYVGGLPQIRRWPFEYKAVFSPADVIEEYTRPSRYVEQGRMVVRPALTDIELLDFPQIGTLEAFNTDGLRTLMRTIDAPNMIEKTLRYPGHAELMRVFRHSGFFDTTLVDVNGCAVSPRAFTSRLLFDQWRLERDEPDITIMRIIVEGTRNDESLRYTYDLCDRYDPKTGVTSMARTTGYTCTLVARMVMNGQFNGKGVSPPEFVGRAEGCFERLLAGYEARGIELKASIETLP